MLGRLFQTMVLVLLWSGTGVQALTTGQALAIARGDSDARIGALNRARADAGERTGAFLQAMAEDAVRIGGDTVVIVRDAQAFDPVTGAAVALPEGAEDAMVNNRMRGELDTALASLRLFSRNDAVRGAAIQTLFGETDASELALVEQALAAETRAGFRAQLQMVRAAILPGSAGVAQRLDAARLMAQGTNRNTRTVPLERLRVEDDATVRAALQASLQAVEGALAWGNRPGAI